MIDLDGLVTPERTLIDLRGGSKRQVLQNLAEAAGLATGVEPGRVLDALLARERLGTTGLGEGVAIPHARIEGLKELIGFFARLARPVDFDALDGEPVDLVFLLLAPDVVGVDHLKALARIARVMRDPVLCAALRAAKTAADAHAILTGGDERPQAGPTP